MANRLRQKRFILALNQIEHDRLKQHAKENQVSASEVLRRLIMDLPITDNKNAAT